MAARVVACYQGLPVNMGASQIGCWGALFLLNTMLPVIGVRRLVTGCSPPLVLLPNDRAIPFEEIE